MDRGRDAPNILLHDSLRAQLAPSRFRLRTRQARLRRDLALGLPKPTAPTLLHAIRVGPVPELGEQQGVAGPAEHAGEERTVGHHHTAAA